MMSPIGLAPDLADALLRRQFAATAARAESIRAARSARPAPRPARAARKPAPPTRPAPRAAASWDAIVAKINATDRRRGPGVINA